MRTELPNRIADKDAAFRFLIDLYRNGEQYHPDDRAADIVWNLRDDQKPTEQECEKLDELMAQVLEFQGPEFDAYSLLLTLGNLQEYVCTYLRAFISLWDNAQEADDATRLKFLCEWYNEFLSEYHLPQWSADDLLYRISKH